MDIIIKEFMKLKTEKQFGDFLQGLLTAKERKELVKRIKIVQMLKKGIPHHEIAKKLGVGVATVTRGSKELQKNRFKSV